MPDESLAKSRALSSPLRMRMLRFCLHEPHTNREIADEFDLTPGTSLHHVRTLVDTGFLAAQEPRIGRRGATEIPYLATRRSWDTDVPHVGPLLVETLAQELVGVPQDELMIARLGLKLDAEHERELKSRLLDVLLEFKDRPADPDGRPVGVFVAAHPEVRRSRPAH